MTVIESVIGWRRQTGSEVQQQPPHAPISVDLDIADDETVTVTLTGRQVREMMALGYRIKHVSRP